MALPRPEWPLCFAQALLWLSPTWHPSRLANAPAAAVALGSGTPLSNALTVGSGETSLLGGARGWPRFRAHP
jgi:hypothetical protein